VDKTQRIEGLRALAVGPAVREAQHARHILRLDGDRGALAGLGLTAPRFEALLAQRHPLPFEDEAHFSAFLAGLRGAVAGALGGASDAGHLRIIGTSATLFSLNPAKSPDRYFDGDRSCPSDLDLGLESPALARWLVERGAPVEPSLINEGGTIPCGAVVRLLPAVGSWLEGWGRALGRKVEAVVPGRGLPLRRPSLMDFLEPLGPSPGRAG